MTSNRSNPTTSLRRGSSRRSRIFAALLAVLLGTAVYLAATAGLPFDEDFSDSNLKDAARTSADWSAGDGALHLQQRHQRFGGFGFDVPGQDITADGNTTAALAWGDVDGDGDLDLVAGNLQRNRLYLNNGTSDPFNGVSGVDITTNADSTRSVVLGDVDRDGDLDLVAGGYSSPIRLYLNNGTPDPWNGVTHINVSASLSMESLALGDVDNDGDLDLVVGRYPQNLLYLNNGTANPWGGVGGINITSDAGSTRSIALGDVDGDGDLDLVAGNAPAVGAINRLYLNNGTIDPWNGVSGIDITADSHGTWSVALGDVDGDGDLDLVAGNYVGLTGQVNRLYLNNGTANPWNGVMGVDITADAERTNSVALGDVDGDGDLDLVTDDFRVARRLYRNNGTSDPWNGVIGIDITTDTGDTEGSILADADGDGDLDLAVARWNSSTNRLYLNTGTTNPWQDVAGQNLTAEVGPSRAVALGDVDGDGDLDMVFGQQGAANRLFKNNGSSSTAGSNISNDVNTTFSVALGDVDGDGDLDFIAGNYFAVNRLYLNNGTANPWSGVAGTNITNDSYATVSVALGDVDRDGDLDLVFGNENQRNRLYLNNGGKPWGGFGAGIDITIDVQASYAVSLGDVDADGDLDLVAGNGFNQRNRLYLNDGVGLPWDTVTGLDITQDALSSAALALGDVDGDGDLDLVAGAYQSQRHQLYLNDGVGDPWDTVTTGVDITTDQGDTVSVALEDVDRDGDLDLLVANRANRTNKLYLNDGDGDPWDTLAAGIDITADADSTHGLALGDLYGHGHLDLVVADDAVANRIYENRFAAEPWNVIAGSDISAETTETRSVALGDVDGDGDLDLVAGKRGLPNRLYLNDGSSDPWSGVTGVDITTDVSSTLAVALGDVDGDGDLDLIDGNQQINQLYLNNGTSDPWNGVTGVGIAGDSRNTQALALGDMDGDGDLDLVSANSGVSRLYLNNGSADPWNGVTGTDIDPVTAFTFCVALGDVDRDGDLDLVLGTFFGSSRLYLNNGTAAPFSGVTGIDITTGTPLTQAVALGDVDGDGDLDLVVGNENAANRLYLNDGIGDPWDTVAGVDITPDSLNSYSLAFADVDRDGDLDLLTGNVAQPNRLYLNDGVGDPWDTLTTGIDITAVAGYTLSVHLQDVNRDGVLDMVAGNGWPNTAQRSRFYAGALPYDTVAGRATSLRVDTEIDPITNATLTPTAILPPNTAIDYFMSNDGGARWSQVRPGVPFSFPEAGFDLRWRAELRALSPVLSPRVEQVEITTQFQPVVIGDRVWDDLDADGVQDAGEAGFAGFTVILLDAGGVFVDSALTDANGDYSFSSAVWGNDYRMQFFPPPGYALAPQDQGADDALDSDVDAVTAETPLFTLGGFDSHTRWDAGMVLTACSSPDEPIYLAMVTLSTDGNDYPVLHFLDANQPTQITGYNVYRASDPGLVTDPASLFATDVSDMDAATPNKQWIDMSGDVSPSGIWYFQVTAYNNRCPAQSAEGPF